jgi:Ca2+-binding EF-hand superfamily protein
LTFERDADTELGTLEAFRVFDRERTGFISKTDLKHIIMNLGEPMSEEVNISPSIFQGYRRSSARS